MKLINRIWLLVMLWGMVGVTAVLAVNDEKPFVIPELKEWKGGEGMFVPTRESRIVCPQGQTELLRIANMLAEDCRLMFGHAPEVVEGKAQKGDLSLLLNKDKKLGKEGYTIRISDRVILAAPEEIGIYWGTRTLLQMVEQQEDRHLPQGTIRDYPDYAMR